MIRNRATYVVIAVAAMIVVYFENGKMAYTFLYAILLMPAISGLLCWVSLHTLSIMQSLEKDRIIKGEETEFRLRICNRWILFSPTLSFKFVYPRFAVHIDAENVALTLPARSRRVIAFTLSGAYRGVYAIGLQSINAMDFLGLFMLNRGWNETSKLVVYPRVVDIARFPLSMNLMSKSYSRFEVRNEDYSTISDVRQYTPTDSMKRIHWKLSAKKGSFMVKNYENTALNSSVIFWDRSPIQGDAEFAMAAEDKAVETAVAVSHYCLRQKIPVDLHCGGGEPLAAANISDFEKLYACAAHSNFDQGEPVVVSLAAFLNAQTDPINLTIITSGMTDPLFDKLAGAYYFGHYVTLLYVPPQNVENSSLDLFGSLQAIGVNAYMLDSAGALPEYF